MACGQPERKMILYALPPHPIISPPIENFRHPSPYCVRRSLAVAHGEGKQSLQIENC